MFYTKTYLTVCLAKIGAQTGYKRFYSAHSYQPSNVRSHGFRNLVFDYKNFIYIYIRREREREEKEKTNKLLLYNILIVGSNKGFLALRILRSSDKSCVCFATEIMDHTISVGLAEQREK